MRVVMAKSRVLESKHETLACGAMRLGMKYGNGQEEEHIW